MPRAGSTAARADSRCRLSALRDQSVGVAREQPTAWPMIGSTPTGGPAPKPGSAGPIRYKTSRNLTLGALQMGHVSGGSPFTVFPQTEHT